MTLTEWNAANRRPTPNLGTTERNAMSEFVLADTDLGVAMRVCICGTLWRESYGTHVKDCPAPTVAAMLAEARAEVDSRIRRAILQPHLRASTEYGPDYCSTCSEAAHDWVTWPCAATEPARAEVAADVETAMGDESNFLHMAGNWYVLGRVVRAALARHMPSAVREGPQQTTPGQGEPGD